MKSPEVEAILIKLRAHIPHRPRPPVKPRKTWQGLRLGSRLVRNDNQAITYEVVGCDSEGVTLRVVAPLLGALTSRLTDPADLQVYTKVAKPRTRKPKDTHNDYRGAD